MVDPVDILLIEDDPADAELTLRALRQQNVSNTVRLARDGAEAIDYLFAGEVRPSTGRPKLVLLDLKLPKLDGLEVLRRIKSDPELRVLPVVVLTSSREAPDLRAAYELGVNSYLCKPVSFVDFAKVVEQLGFYWLVINEPPA